MAKVVSPEEFFGFRIGEDRRLARWDRIVEYFKSLSENSDRVIVEELGKTAGGNPFLVVFISSPENLRLRSRIQDISRRLAYPYGLSEEEARRLAKEGRAVVAISGSLHATEVSGTQTLIEVCYELATRDDEAVNRILENTLVIVFPCLNPDGQVMVVDWYNKYLGTDHEGSPPPWLYHRYCGHDNNRDAFMLTQPESRYFAKIVYREWVPQVFVDHHQMGGTAARFFVSPEMDPIYPEIDPLVWREIQFLGAYTASRLAMRGFKGVETYSPFTPDFASAFQTITNYMNIVGLLTEAASVKIATPIYVHPHQLQGYERGRLRDQPQINYPDPWPGGWWRLRDIVEYQKEATYAILEAAAIHREELLLNMYIKSRRSIERGMASPPYAFIIPRDQHDPLTLAKMLETLLQLGIEVHVAKSPFELQGKVYPEGTYVVFASQPRRALLMKLLERYMYPDNELTRDRDGNPIRPYDLATERLSDFMGVEVEEAAARPAGEFERLACKPARRPEVSHSSHGWILDPRLNDSHRVAFSLLSSGFEVQRLPLEIRVGAQALPPGSFYVPDQEGVFDALSRLAGETCVPPIPLGEEPGGGRRISIPRIAVYQRLYGGNIDEGWIRWLLDTFGVPFKSMEDGPIKDGRIGEEADILILPSDSLAFMKGENIEEELSKVRGQPVKLPPWPPEYRSGFTQAGVDNIRKFVEAGGILLVIGNACEILSKGFRLPVNDLSEQLKDPKKYFCPGSTLRALVDFTHPLAWGMPRETKVLFTGKPVLAVTSTYESELYREVVRFPDKNLLSSGWLIGEEYLSRKPLLLEICLGKGRIYAYSFRPHFRGQTHATFKLLLNALYKIE